MRILFITARPPWPSRRGDQARAAGLVRELGQRHEVKVLALRPAGFPATEFPAGVAGREVRHSRLSLLAAPYWAWRLPAQVALHVSRPLRVALAEEIEDFRPDVLVPVLSRVGWLMEPILGSGELGVPTVIDLVDSLELNMVNRAHRQPWLRPFLLWEARRIAAWERLMARHLAAATVVSERDRHALMVGAPELAAKIHVIPFGLSVPNALPPSTEGEVVLLSGNLGYFPTVDAASWFAEAIWPRIRARRPEAEWWLAGARPTPAIRRLASLPGVRLHVEPEDLGALRRQAAVAVVPLRSGSGTPIKILEAMADGVPVVTTTAGRQGLDGIDDDAVRVADGEEAFAGAVVDLLGGQGLLGGQDLLGEPGPAARQRQLAWRWVRDRHALYRVVEPFEDLLRNVARRTI